MSGEVKLKLDAFVLLVAAFFMFLGGYPNRNGNEAFTERHSNNDGKEEIRMIAVGDIMLSREVARKMKARGNYKYPSLKTEETTAGADIALGNLESPIIDGREIGDDEMIFRADPESIEGLKFAGFDVLNLANNHIMNFGRNGLENTINILNKNGILHTGAGIGVDGINEPAIMVVKGTKFAFLGYTYNLGRCKLPDGRICGSANMNIEKMKENVEKAEHRADIVIVSMHAGTEYKSEPDGFQKSFAHAAIDAGADLVIGHHPHVVQPVEKYNGGYIMYSLGNFVFDQMWSEETRLGAMAEVIFRDGKVSSVGFLPVKIYDYSQPRLAEGVQRESILEKLKF